MSFFDNETEKISAWAAIKSTLDAKAQSPSTFTSYLSPEIMSLSTDRLRNTTLDLIRAIEGEEDAPDPAVLDVGQFLNIEGARNFFQREIKADYCDRFSTRMEESDFLRSFNKANLDLTTLGDSVRNVMTNRAAVVSDVYTKMDSIAYICDTAISLMEQHPERTLEVTALLQKARTAFLQFRDVTVELPFEATSGTVMSRQDRIEIGNKANQELWTALSALASLRADDRDGRLVDRGGARTVLGEVNR